AKRAGRPGLAADWRPVLTPALDALAARDGGGVVDWRSGGYAAQWRAPAERTVAVDVFQVRGGERTVVSHFGKQSRGVGD
ncbi:peroxide stress protein YaaA, partial [Micrococcus sp. SIMBA_144]